ncbi:TniB family NTP-binding protein [Tenacibaculum sp. SDUM215027]|uniref:TniB family NTP-binding protein n=1 Tax=Tenacibaculum sp. SDUM215027 TaxID=3422596 RepID=UPI003D319F0D
MKHLHTKTRDFLVNANNDERIDLLRKNKWIGYSKALEILGKFDELKEYPRSHRMPNLLLVGESNNGKTALLQRYMAKNQASIDENTSEAIVPVLYVQAPPEPDQKRFYNTILEALLAPYKSSEKIEIRERRTFHLMRKLNVRLLIIDEIHHILAGTISKQRVFLNTLKYISNELQISLICSGTRDAFNAIQTNPQLANRFEPKILSKWNNNEEYLRLLASFERLLPLKEESFLYEPSMAKKILSKSEGLIGEISKILELSGIFAIQNGYEKITKSIIDNIDYTSPSDRKKAIYKL